MNAVYIRLFAYGLATVMALGLGAVAGLINGIDYDAVTRVATIDVAEAANGIAIALGVGFGGIGAIFAKWGTK